MNGSNLPPGVSVNDIPGNRPEDLVEDRLAGLIATEAVEHDAPEAVLEWLFEAGWPFVMKVVAIGYLEGSADARDDVAERIQEVARRYEASNEEAS